MELILQGDLMSDVELWSWQKVLFEMDVSVELESFKDGGAKLRSCLDSDVGAELGSWLG